MTVSIPLRRRGVVRGAVALAATAAVATTTLVVADAAGTDRTNAVKNAVIGGQARSVILLIGDGMGDSEITIARNYIRGAAGTLSMDRLPLTGDYTTYSVQRTDPTVPDYVPDSAATGTAWATGHKSYDGAISVLPDGTPVPTVLELAKQDGYRTGNVTTAELQDATPAVLASHVVSRDCKGPQSMAPCAVNDKVNGGAGSIAEQIVQTKADITLGGGAQFFDQTVQAGRYAGLTVAQQAQVSGYSVVRDPAALARAAAAAGTKPILGTFASNNFDLEYVGPTPTAANTTPARCRVNTARNTVQPHLSDMAQTAIDVLDKRARGQQKGFFLQIEGASIDKQDHAANPCGQIGETGEFDKAVGKALAYQQVHPDTLVIVTADHGHTSQIVEAGSTTTGVTATLVTHDNASMTISYATTPFPGSQQHTGTQVRIAAGGPQAANVVGKTDQTTLFSTMNRALGITT